MNSKFIILTLLWGSAQSATIRLMKDHLKDTDPLASMVGFWESEKVSETTIPQYKAVIFHNDKYHAIWWPKTNTFDNSGIATLTLEDGRVLKKWENREGALAWVADNVYARLGGYDIRWYWVGGNDADTWRSYEEEIPELPNRIKIGKLREFHPTIEKMRTEHNAMVQSKKAESIRDRARANRLARANAPRKSTWTKPTEQNASLSDASLDAAFNQDDFPTLTSKGSSSVSISSRSRKPSFCMSQRSTEVSTPVENLSHISTREEIQTEDSASPNVNIPASIPSVSSTPKSTKPRSSAKSRSNVKPALCSVSKFGTVTSAPELSLETPQKASSLPSEKPNDKVYVRFPVPDVPPPPPPPTQVDSEWTFDIPTWADENNFEISRHETDGEQWCFNKTLNTWFWETHFVSPVSNPTDQGFEAFTSDGRRVMCWNSTTGAFFFQD